MFYGWYIVLAACGIQWLPGVLFMQSFGAYTALIQAEMGWSKAVLAGAFALTRVESGLLGPFQGWLADRYGPRIILTIGLGLFGVGFILFGFIDTVLTYYLAFAVIAIGSSLGGFQTLMVSIVSWFDRYRARAVAVSQLGYSIGGLCVPLIIIALTQFGWRATAIASGIAVILIGIPLAQIVRHRPPPDVEPDGTKVQDADDDAPQSDGVRDFTAREAMRTRAFWFISLGHALALLTVSTVMVHLILHLTESLEFTSPAAGLVVALMTAFQMIGQILGGFLGDRFNKRFVCVGCMLGHATGFFLLAYADSLAMVIAFAVLHGLGWGVRGPLMVAFRADYFGPGSFGTIMGFSSLIVMFGMSGGPIIAGLMADASGSYESSFALLASGSLLGAIFFWAAKRPDPPTREIAVQAPRQTA